MLAFSSCRCSSHLYVVKKLRKRLLQETNRIKAMTGLGRLGVNIEASWPIPRLMKITAPQIDIGHAHKYYQRVGKLQNRRPRQGKI